MAVTAGSSIQSYQQILDRLIGLEREGIVYYAILATGVFFFGVLLIVVAFIEPDWLDVEPIKGILSTGGGLLTFLGALPFKPILGRREKIGIFRELKQQLSQVEMSMSEGPVDEDYLRRIFELVSQAVTQIISR